MKLLGAVFVACLAVGPLAAQHWTVGGFGSIAFPAGVVPSGNPYGNIVTPARPQGPVAAGRYGYSGGYGASGYGGYRGTGRGYRNGRSGVYAYPIYIGGYGYGYGYGPDSYGPDSYGAPPPDNGGSGGGAPPAPPVVINQYFGAPPPPGLGQDAPQNGTSDPTYRNYPSPAKDDTSASDAPYYLIAFKDHTIYSAVAYYTEGDTLHYFTAGNVHNQVSLSLVDRQLTEQLNHQHNVELRLP